MIMLHILVAVSPSLLSFLVALVNSAHVSVLKAELWASLLPWRQTWFLSLLPDYRVVARTVPSGHID